MKLRHIQMFCRLADFGLNISRTAQAMHTSQPNLTRHLQALEKELGVALFVRSQRRILSYTDAGREALMSSRRVLSEVAYLGDVGQKSARELSGHMTVAVSHTQARYFLPSIVEAFTKRYPKVRMVLRQGDPTQLINWLASGDADIAVSSQPNVSPANLVFFPCHESPRVILAPPRHPLTRPRRPTLAQLARYPLITYDDSFAIHTRVIETFERQGFVPNIVLTATDTEVMKTYVRRGLGVAIVASLAFGGKEDTDLRAIPANHLFEPAFVKIVLRKGTVIRPYVLDFIQSLSPSLDTGHIQTALNS